MKAIFPGSFDPITLGHLDLIRRAAAFCEELTVAILVKPDKAGVFTLNQRLDMVKSACSDLPNCLFITSPLSYQRWDRIDVQWKSEFISVCHDKNAPKKVCF